MSAARARLPGCGGGCSVDQPVDFAAVEEDSSAIVTLIDEHPVPLMAAHLSAALRTDQHDCRIWGVAMCILLLRSVRLPVLWVLVVWRREWRMIVLSDRCPGDWIVRLVVPGLPDWASRAPAGVRRRWA